MNKPTDRKEKLYYIWEDSESDHPVELLPYKKCNNSPEFFDLPLGGTDPRKSDGVRNGKLKRVTNVLIDFCAAEIVGLLMTIVFGAVIGFFSGLLVIGGILPPEKYETVRTAGFLLPAIFLMVLLPLWIGYKGWNEDENIVEKLYFW